MVRISGNGIDMGSNPISNVRIGSDADLVDKKYVEAVKEELQEYVDEAVIGGSGEEVDLSDYYKKSEVDDLINAIPEVDLSGYYDKTEVYSKLESYSKSEVDALITGGGADLSDYYTKEQVDSLIGAIPETDLSNYYDKTQTETLLSNKVDKEVGKGLSTNDFTDTFKQALESNKVQNVTTDSVNKKLVVTYTDGAFVDLNLDDIVTDVKVEGAVLDATTNVLTILSSDGGAEVTVDLSAFVTNQTLSNVLAGKADEIHTHSASDIEGLDTTLSNKVDKNEAIIGDTKTKITYDSNGLVTGGADLVEADIPNLPQSRITNLVSDLDGKQPVLMSGTNIKTINGESILGEGNVVITGGGGSSNLSELSDTEIISPENGESLVYDEATGKWTNKPMEGTGSDGLSAYELYVKNLPDGDTPLSEIEWLDSLKGENGKDGIDGLPGVDGIDGLPGKDGKDGVDGADGLPGKDGVDSTVELAALTDKLEAKGVEANKVLTSKGDGTSEWLAPSGGGSGGDVDLDEVFEEIGKKQDTLVSGESIKTVNNESILGQGDIQIEQGIDASTLTEEQLDYLRDKQLSYGVWQTTNIGATPFALTHGVTRMPMFRNASKEGNLVNNDDYSITLKKGMLYRFEFFISCQYSAGGQCSYGVYNSDTGAVIKTIMADTVTGTNHRGSLDQPQFYFRFDEDTRIEVRPTYAQGNIASFYSMRVQIMEISSVDMKLARFTINGKSFDENNNIDLEGLSTLSNPKLNEEVLTEYRHPVSGKPIYTKTIDFGALPNKTTKSVPHNIDYEWLMIDYGSSYTYNVELGRSTNSVMNGNYSRMYIDGQNILCIATENVSSSIAVLVLQYTKTTDTVESPVRLVGGGLDPDKDIELTAGKGVVMTSENGTKYKLYIDNDGTLTTEVV